jgi:ABC-type antimicrobial peptide transport system permease subunit
LNKFDSRRCVINDWVGIIFPEGHTRGGQNLGRSLVGIMKGIGISPRAIQFSYVVQAFFYGITGSVVGLVFTFGFLKPYFDAHPINFPFSDGILVATPLGSGIRVAILLVITLLAGYVPAKLIIRKNTLDSILGR